MSCPNCERLRKVLEAISKDGYWNYPVKESGVSRDREWMPTSPAIMAKDALALPSEEKKVHYSWCKSFRLEECDCYPKPSESGGKCRHEGWFKVTGEKVEYRSKEWSPICFFCHPEAYEGLNHPYCTPVKKEPEENLINQTQIWFHYLQIPRKATYTDVMIFEKIFSERSTAPKENKS